ncbi:hypothetical protein X946_4558 [Burkholderia sp. ABCPW 111]|nr:hypothetical protein X946_4558 [Burkholderia sp. ABCPW 111]
MTEKRMVENIFMVFLSLSALMAWKKELLGGTALPPGRE